MKASIYKPAMTVLALQACGECADDSKGARDDRPSLLGTVELDGADWLLEGDVDGAMLGASVDAWGDQNAAGVPGLAVGGIGYPWACLAGESPHDQPGALFLVNGPLEGSITASESDACIGSTDSARFLGADAKAVHDADDGTPDIVVVGAPGIWPFSFPQTANPEPGAVLLFAAPLEGTLLDTDADATLAGPGEPYPFLGARVESSDDVDGDAVPDLLLPAVGAAWVVPASITGEHPVDDVASIRFTSGGETGEDGYEQDPVYVHGVGDLDGDGLGDIAVTVFSDVLRGWTKHCWTGDVVLYTDTGPGDRVPSDADATFLSFGESDDWVGNLCQRAGTSVALVGDVDGDGRGDLAVGAPWFWVGKTPTDRDYLPGRVYVWTGPVTGTQSLSESTAIVEGAEDVQEVGAHIAGPADVDGDGQADLLTGSLVYRGPLEGSLGVGDADVRFIDGDYPFWGLTVATADVDADGRSDILLGQPAFGNEWGDYVGAAFLFYGR